MKPSMGNLMKQAQKMQAEMAKIQQELAEETVEASSGGGTVKVTVTGALEVKGVKIDPEAVDPNDVEMLEDLVVAATNEAMRQAQDLATSKMNRVTGGMNIPGLT